MITMIAILIMIYYWKNVKDDYLPLYSSTFFVLIIGIEFITDLSMINMLATQMFNIYNMI